MVQSDVSEYLGNTPPSGFPIVCGMKVTQNIFCPPLHLHLQIRPLLRECKLTQGWHILEKMLFWKNQLNKKTSEPAGLQRLYWSRLTEERMNLNLRSRAYLNRFAYLNGGVDRWTGRSLPPLLVRSIPRWSGCTKETCSDPCVHTLWCIWIYLCVQQFLGFGVRQVSVGNPRKSLYMRPMVLVSINNSFVYQN